MGIWSRGGAPVEELPDPFAQPVADAGPAPGLCHAVLTGVAIAGLIGSAFAIQYVFEGRSFTFWAINAGYHLVQFTIIGLVIGLWP